MKNPQIKQIRKVALLLTLVMFVSQHAYSQGNMAGEISFQHIDGNTYRIQITIYTTTYSFPDGPRLELLLGDGTSQHVNTTSVVLLSNNYVKNTYAIDYKYPGPGTYVVSFEDPGRNEGVRNIPNSVNEAFALKTILQINPSLGANSSPYFENPPMDIVLIDSIYTYNSKATDPDGDSLSYKLTECIGENLLPINNYQYPEASISFDIDPVNGDLIWNKPIYLDLYSVAIEIEEWRSGIKIGSVIRDMQFEVVDKLTGIVRISESKIKVYPNPTNDIIHFDFAGNEIEQIRILDLNGKLMLIKTSVDQNETLNLSKFQNGVYFILIRTDKKTIVNKIIRN